MSDRGESHPPAPRTRREGLPSPGSHKPTFGARNEMPMSEQRGLILTNSIEPRPGSKGLATQSFELLHGPSDQVLVDAPCDASRKYETVVLGTPIWVAEKNSGI